MEFKHVEIKNIRLDRENPRISDALSGWSGSEEEEQEYIKDHLAGDTGNSEPGPSCLELKKSILKSNGIIEPIIILERDDGTYLCIEGNTRLSIYFKFAESEEHSHNEIWKSIPSLVHKELSEEEIDALRLQAHFVGKKEWTPYAKGRYITSLIKKGMEMEDIKQIVGGSDSKIRNNYTAFSNYKEFYEPLFDESRDGKFPRKDSISMFVQVPDGGKNIVAMEERGHNIEDFAKWVKDGKVNRATDVGRFLDKIMMHDEAYNRFIANDGTLENVITYLPSNEDMGTVKLKDASYIQICDFLNDNLLEQRNNGTLKKIKDEEGKGVIDSMELLRGELEKSIEILEEE